jgi:hypothetical protein
MPVDRFISLQPMADFFRRLLHLKYFALPLASVPKCWLTFPMDALSR